MRAIYLFVLSGLLAIGMAVGAAQPSDGIDLSLGLKPGEVVKYTIESTERSLNTTQGQRAFRRTFDYTLEISVELTRLDESGGDANVSLLAYSFGTTGSNGRRHGFDSRNPDENEITAPFADHLKPLLNAPVTVVFDSGGNILELHGVDALQRTDLFMRLERELFSLDAMRRKVGPILGAGKVPPVSKLRDAWSLQSSVPLSTGFTLEVNTRRTFSRHKEDVAALEDFMEFSIAPVDADARVVGVFDNGFGAASNSWNTKRGKLELSAGQYRFSAFVTTDGVERKLEMELHETIRPVAQ